MKHFEWVQLDNGIRVVFAPRKGSLATTVMVLVEAGSKYETKEQGGISHFLEHMVFKGTERRPTAMDISSELDGLGAQYNAFTSQEVTAYYAKVKNEFFEKAFDVVSDIYVGPTFDAKEIEKEKGVIVEEINMYEDLPQRKAQELFLECVYGDQPAGWPIAGTRETVRSFGRKDFISYRSAHYVPRATVVVVAGGFEVRDAKRLIRESFEKLEMGEKSPKPAVDDVQAHPKELVRYKKSDQTHLVLGFRAFSLSDPRRYALRVLVDILGGGMSSRLFHRIREQMGAAYYVRAVDDLYSDHGLVSMSAGVQHEKLRDVLVAGLEEFRRLREKLVSEKELKKSRDHVIGTFSLSLETSDELAGYYGLREVLEQDLMAPEEVMGKIADVSADQVRSVARDLFVDSDLNLAVIGPHKDVSFCDALGV